MGPLEWILAAVSMIAVPLAIAWLRAELSVLYELLIKWIVRCAASSMPEQQRHSTEAEWLAIINEIRSPTWKVVNAASLLLNAYRSRQAFRDSFNPREAILSKSEVELWYNGHRRLVEIHAVGATPDGREIMRVWQIAGAGNPPVGWKMMRLDQTTGAKMTKEKSMASGTMRP